MVMSLILSMTTLDMEVACIKVELLCLIPLVGPLAFFGVFFLQKNALTWLSVRLDSFS